MTPFLSLLEEEPLRLDLILHINLWELCVISSALESLFTQLFLELMGMGHSLGKDTPEFPGPIVSGLKITWRKSCDWLPFSFVSARTQESFCQDGEKCWGLNQSLCLHTGDSWKVLLQFLIIILCGIFFKITLWLLLPGVSAFIGFKTSVVNMWFVDPWRCLGPF